MGCYDVSAWQRMLWAENGAPIPQGDAKAAGFSAEFMPEVFHRLYSEEPRKVVDPGKGAASRAKLHDLVTELPEFATLRRSTVREAAWSAMAAQSLGEAVAKALPESRQPPPDADRARKVLQGLQALADGGLPLDGEIAAAEAAIAEEEAAVAVQADGIDGSAVRMALRRAIARAHDEVDEARETCATLGATPENARELARIVKNSPKLAEIVQIAGRLQATARAKRATRSEYARSEVVGIEPTGDVGRLLPSELVALADPLRFVDLVRRLGERSAMGYQVRGKEKSAKGPILVCIDQSGSMQGAPDVWAKAVALAVLDIARHESRAFGVCLFNDAIGRAYMADRPEASDPTELLELLSREPSGDTNFSPPMTWAVGRIGEASGRKTFARADVILITDGEASSQGAKEIRARLTELGAQSFGIAIGCRASALEPWCDRAVAIDDVSADTAATDLIFDGI